MKKLMIALMTLTVLGTTMSACTKKDEVTPASTNTETTITEVERQYLTFLREEEKMARDVYTTLLAKYPSMTFFSNISGSEQKHMDAVLGLLNTYNLTDPVGGNSAGVFTNTDIQQLYNTLVAKGNISELDAVIVGLTIEDMDIYDLENGLADITQEDIRTVYTNLIKASKNHMREFYSQLQARGGTYTPQYISQELYDEIINTPKQHGSGG